MQNYTVRPTILKYNKNLQGITSIRICVTVNRKRTYLPTEYKVHVDQWDDKKALVVGHENAAMINVALRRQITDLERDFIAHSLEGTNITKKVIKGNLVNDKPFASFAREVRADEKEITRVINFAGDGLMLSEMNVTFLRRFEQHEKKRGIAPNTINTLFKYLRRIITQAKAEKLIKDNPFDEYEIVRYRQTDRTYLTMDELKMILVNVDKMSGTMRNTTYYFLLGCYSGLRHSDWCRFSYETMVEGEFLKLRAKKNKKHVVMPIGKTLRKILKVVKDLPPPLSNQKCNVMLKAVASRVDLKKELTTHVGRHTFGCMCAANKIPKSVTAELMGVNTQTVEVYYHLTGENIIQQAAILKTL